MPRAFVPGYLCSGACMPLLCVTALISELSSTFSFTLFGVSPVDFLTAAFFPVPLISKGNRLAHVTHFLSLSDAKQPVPVFCFYPYLSMLCLQCYSHTNVDVCCFELNQSLLWKKSGPNAEHVMWAAGHLVAFSYLHSALMLTFTVYMQNLSWSSLSHNC